MANTQCGFLNVPGGASAKDLLVSYGPTIFVDIGFDPNFKLGQPNPPVPGITGIRALVDSGATESCIDSVLAAQLNLPIIDRRTFSGIGGKHEVNIHLAQVRFPSLNFTLYGAFAGVHLEAGGQWHKALIGRTFLQHYTMTYEGRTGVVTLSQD
ncbi:MAG TPA: hypothetical protein VK815_04885 [Candidatus Acidoferrales bacterium]|jgi:hypothetical protein|nr:hypothetical protein [Candidatus Acidoferrales bacterium]